MQKVLAAIAVVLAIVLFFQWRAVEKSEAGTKQLIADVNSHAYGGAPREELESYLSSRGGDVNFENLENKARAFSVDHVVFRNIRHLNDAREDLHVELYYDEGDHLTYFTIQRVWERPKKR